MFKIAKINKRMHIIDESGERVYSPPDFVVMQNRENLQEVADKFNTYGKYDIDAVIEFEYNPKFRRDLRKKLNK